MFWDGIMGIIKYFRCHGGLDTSHPSVSFRILIDLLLEIKLNELN